MLTSRLVRSALAVVALAANLTVAAEIRLGGAGATFPNPLYQQWVTEYQKFHPDVKIDYQSIGSGGGIKAITEKTVAFAGSDAPMNKKEIAAAGGEENLIEIPSCAGAVVPALNLPGVTKDVNLTGEVIADIYAGKISKWNDKRIAELNAGLSLPDTAITPVYRTDGSGTTFVFTSYLATQSESFKSSIGTGKQVKWPVGQGGKGNEGVAGAVSTTPGAIGYIELNYATANKIAFAAVKNANGKFVKASAKAISAAGEGALPKLKGNLLAADIWNQPGDESYPISGFTYIIIYKDLANLKSIDEAKALTGFLDWATGEKGQELAEKLDYAPLSAGVQAKVKAALRSTTFKGQTLWSADQAGGN